MPSPSSLHDLFPTQQVDGRRSTATLYRETLDNIVEELGGNVTGARLESARRLAGLVLAGQKYEAQIIAGDDINMRDYLTYQNCFTRLVKELGLLPRHQEDDETDGLELEDFLPEGGVS